MPSLQAGVAAASLNSFRSPHPHLKGSIDPQMTSGSGAASPSSSSVASTSTSNTNLPVRASCDECRRRKLKCDGNRETCDRCKASGVQCHYNVRARIGRPKGTTKAARAASVSTTNGASPPGAAPSPPAAKKQRYTPPEVSNSLPASTSSASSYLATIPVAPPAVDDPFKMLNLPGTSSSSSYASNPFGVAPGSSNEPSALDSLELAAYLESLDRVKISSSDGLTAGMLQGGDSFGPPPPPPPVPSYLMGSSAGTSGGFDSDLLLGDVNGSAASLQAQPQSTGSSSSSWWAGTILDEAVSYAVPSDLSWCHWNLDEGLMGTMPSSSSATSQQQQNGTTAASHHAGAELAAGPGHQAAEWPRGAQEGMGNGHIETQEGGIVQGGPWPSAVAPPQLSTPAAPKKSCCSSKAKAETPQPVPEASPKMKKGPCPRTGAASCCCSTTTTDSISSPAKSSTTKLDHERGRPATSPGASASSSSPRVHCVPNPSGTGCTCLCQSDVCLLRVKRTLSPSSGADDGDLKGSRGGVGAGGSDESLSLHLTLSASQAISASCACSSTCPTCAKPPTRADGEENSGGEEGVEGESAAAAAHRAKRYNASLLISLALQIYTRAVRILRDGFGISTGAGTSTSTSTGTALLGNVGTPSRPATSSSSSSLLPTSSSSQSTVQIGSSYVPRPANAQRIALLAIRLELLDLEEGMARIWQMGGGGASANGASNGAGSSGSNGNGSSSNGTGSATGTATALLAPIDGLVISKLRGQLREMVGRVEGLERDWDKRRGEGRAMP